MDIEHLDKSPGRRADASYKPFKSSRSFSSGKELDDTEVTPVDKLRVESQFRSQKSKVYVCNCQAKLYETSKTSSIELNKQGKWNFKCNGIPTLLLQTIYGKNQLQLIIANKKIGFELWKETVSDSSRYFMESESSHLFKRNEKIPEFFCIAFEDRNSGAEFFTKYQEFLRESKSGLTIDKRIKPKKKIMKDSISLPCCFDHVISMNSSEGFDLLKQVKKQ